MPVLVLCIGTFGVCLLRHVGASHAGSMENWEGSEAFNSPNWICVRLNNWKLLLY